MGTVLAAVLLGSFTFALGMLNVSGMVMTTIVGALLVGAMVLPRLAARLVRMPWRLGRKASAVLKP